MIFVGSADIPARKTQDDEYKKDLPIESQTCRNARARRRAIKHNEMDVKVSISWRPERSWKDWRNDGDRILSQGRGGY